MIFDPELKQKDAANIHESLQYLKFLPILGINFRKAHSFSYLNEKCNISFQLLELKDIKWHFIGHLQSNKCNNLAGKKDFCTNKEAALNVKCLIFTNCC